MSEPLVLRQDQGPVAHLTLNSPSNLNALSETMIETMTNELAELATDQNIRAVTLKGAGKAFCAGHNLKEMTAGRQTEDGGAAYFNELFASCSKMMLAINKLPQPVIAQVHGIATAAGCQLVATCDLAVAAEGTKFGVNGVNIGLFCSTPMVALSRNINRKKTFEMLVTGDFIEASEAKELGLINRAVPEAELEAETNRLATQIASKLGSAVRVGKEAFYNQLQMPLADAYAYTGDVMATNMLDKATEAGIQAFLEKRTPEWDQ